MHGRTLFLLLLMCIASTCTEQQNQGPSTAIVEGLEERLTQVPCIGDLDRWHREYAFGKPVNRPVNYDVIHIWYRVADSFEPAGQFIRGTIEEWPIDDSPVDMVLARYDVSKDQLTLEHCGANWRGVSRPERIIP